MEKYLRDVREGKVKSKPRKFESRIILDENSVSTISIGKKQTPTINLMWSDITKAHAFKRDLFSIDCICIFLSRADDSGVELDEYMQGWEEFIDSLPKYLTGCQTMEKWFPKVAHPAFATNLTVIFSRELIPSIQGGSI
jgi:hypothetical protein